MATVKKIGILGGSFNPAHNGHLEISNAVMDTLQLDEIWWVITSSNPLKASHIYESLEDRIQIANQIIANNKISIHEFESKIESRYTIDLIEHLQVNYNHNFVWIMGADNLTHFNQWHRANDIVSSVKIAICNRPDYTVTDNDLQQSLLCDTNHIFKGEWCDFMDCNSPQIIYIKSTNNKNSSTDIRNGND